MAKSPKIKSVSEDLSATEMVVSILERTTQTVTICHAFELPRKVRQLVTDCHRFKVGDKLSPSLQKKEALSGLEKGLVLATCHIMTNEEDCSALAYRGTILDTCTKITFSFFVKTQTIIW